MSFVFPVNSDADLVRLIALNRQIGATHRVILLRALAARRIGLYEPQRATSGGQIKPFLAALKRRSVIVIGDDDDFPTGPGGWCQAARLLRWASFVIAHGTGARDDDYHQAVEIAEAGHRVLLIECTSASVPAWQTAVAASPNRPPGLVIIPPPGTGPHPAANKRERMQ